MQYGHRQADDQNMLRAGARGPAALEDFHFREKIFHFDHQRIPERVVQRAASALMVENYESLSDITRANVPLSPNCRDRKRHKRWSL